MKRSALILIFLAGNLFALDKDEMLAIAEEVHDRSEILEELKIYPDGREYEASVKSGAPGEKLEKTATVAVKEKIVRGRYVVSEFEFPGLDTPMIMIVTYEKKADVFRKWVLLPDGTIGSSTGVGDLKKRTIAWISDDAGAEGKPTILTLETHSDKKSTWKETFFEEGKVVLLTRGVATKVK